MKVEYFKNLLNVVMNYEKETRRKIDDFYIPVKDIDITDTEITRETIIHALGYASITKEFHMVMAITPYLYAKSYKYSENNDILDYILEHAIPTQQYIDGEEEKLIFNSDNNSLEYGYIYNHNVKLERRKK